MTKEESIKKLEELLITNVIIGVVKFDNEDYGLSSTVSVGKDINEAVKKYLVYKVYTVKELMDYQKKLLTNK